MSDLFSELQIRPGVTAKNRIWLAPLTNKQSHADGTLSDDELRFLSMRAEGGFGVVETCATYVSPEGKSWEGELGAHDDAMGPGLTRLAKTLAGHGAIGCVQLFHGGLRAEPSVSGHPRWSASAYEDGVHALSEADLARVELDFVRAAQRSQQAGFPMVELHGAHGYLFSQFLSREYNRREDRWGGSLENRKRLLLDTARAIRAQCPDLALAVRISPEDFGQARGLDLDESLEVASDLARIGIDVLHVSLWRADLNTQKRPEQHPTRLFREAVGPAVRIVVAGKIWTQSDAETQLELGADMVALGRSAIANHDWPKRILEGRPLQLAPVSIEALRAEGLSSGFAEYMRAWKGFVAD
jgi:2,4-dienoyl-CoA reductase-like NADH-dependent reductase (Old Yellow Enzyme family)